LCIFIFMFLDSKLEDKRYFWQMFFSKCFSSCERNFCVCSSNNNANLLRFVKVILIGIGLFQTNLNTSSVNMFEIQNLKHESYYRGSSTSFNI
jgi:hypothetical protein